MTPLTELIINLTPIFSRPRDRAFNPDPFRRSLHSFLSRRENRDIFPNEVYYFIFLKYPQSYGFER